jgi:hypothetical protein
VQWRPGARWSSTGAPGYRYRNLQIHGAARLRRDLFDERGSPAFYSRFCAHRFVESPFENRASFIEATSVILFAAEFCRTVSGVTGINTAH